MQRAGTHWRKHVCASNRLLQFDSTVDHGVPEALDNEDQGSAQSSV